MYAPSEVPTTLTSDVLTNVPTDGHTDVHAEVTTDISRYRAAIAAKMSFRVCWSHGCNDCSVL